MMTASPVNWKHGDDLILARSVSDDTAKTRYPPGGNAARPYPPIAPPPRAPFAAPNHTEGAPGIHLFQTVRYGDVGLDGNSIGILSDEGVLVFDANGTPAAARAVLAEIRKLTKQPVRYLVLSHWHWDHWYGA